jgi:signal transduction histidine kinase/CheY-like chemotaxis protein
MFAMGTAPSERPRPIAPARGRAPASGATAPAARPGRDWRSLREWLESLSLGDQFRAVVMISIAVAVLAAQALTVPWAALRARHDIRSVARTLPAAVESGFTERGGADLLRGVPHHPDFLAVTLSAPSGEILSRYVRADLRGRKHAYRTAAMFRRAGEGGVLRGTMRLLALEPIPLEYPVQLRPDLSATVVALVDNGAIWRAALRELSELPVMLAVGLLLAFLAANSLRRYVVEPLAQLASATRVGNWQGGPAPEAPRRGNELSEISANFEALAERLAAYERDFRNVRIASGQQIVERTRELESRMLAAEALTRSKDEFLANMSHEIRTPMNGVLGMAELLAGTKLDKRQRRFVESMRAAAETMMQIINDILDDSKIEAGKLDIQREPFAVRALVEEVGQLFAGAAERKRLELICRVEPTVPHVVVGDVLRLRQVLGNLLSNAVKYTERGEIQLRVADDAVSESACNVVFSVSDTGPGIPAAQHAAVFEAYTQLENAARIGGTGLGLSIARRLVRLMGGERIDLHSEPGHGSTFSFSLPFDVAERHRASEQDAAEFAGLRVLVVDDSASSYMGLEEALKTWSAETTVLNRGRMVPERLRSAALRGQPFDVVLLDHSLPDASSADLLREVRMDPAIGATYVVLLTALAFDVAYEGTKAIEPDTCIAKPVRLELLKGALRAARAPRAPRASADAAPAAAARPAPSTAAMLGLEVLVVDDNAVNREVAVAMLEECGCRVTVAHDGHEAVQQAHAHRFDAILMDCQMPGLDGFAATAAIRHDEAERGQAAVSIVALTANVLSRDRARCIAAGMNGFLGKPFTAAQLIGVLLPIARQRGTLREALLPEVTVEDDDPSLEIEIGLEVEPRPPSAPGADQFEATVTDMLAAPLFEPAAVLPPVLDNEQIKTIRALGKPHVFQRLCELLFESAPATLQNIERALAAGDLAAIAAAAHSLKSASSNLGGRRLAAQLDRCESLARDGADIAAVRNAAAGLRQSYAALASALNELASRKTGS